VWDDPSPLGDNPMRRPRVRLRTSLILVLLIGGAAGGYVFWRRSAEFRRRAAKAESDEVFYTESARKFETHADDLQRSGAQILRSLQELGDPALYGPRDSPEAVKSSVEEARLLATEARNSAEHYARLKLKYDRAARHPWLAVEPDPLTPWEESFRGRESNGVPALPAPGRPG
jgi:hypothetical protein